MTKDLRRIVVAAVLSLEQSTFGNSMFRSGLRSVWLRLVLRMRTRLSWSNKSVSQDRGEQAEIRRWITACVSQFPEFIARKSEVSESKSSLQQGPWEITGRCWAGDAWNAQVTPGSTVHRRRQKSSYRSREVDLSSSPSISTAKSNVFQSTAQRNHGKISDQMFVETYV